mmetsp:Transcript_20130/g.39537  ORF Transcript_20130/g.39537 Transcript_20130/m.39537 type:complete len:112 (-) Transcript_20130:194-529(-)
MPATAAALHAPICTPFSKFAFLAKPGFAVDPFAVFRSLGPRGLARGGAGAEHGSCDGFQLVAGIVPAAWVVHRLSSLPHAAARPSRRNGLPRCDADRENERENERMSELQI